MDGFSGYDSWVAHTGRDERQESAERREHTLERELDALDERVTLARAAALAALAALDAGLRSGDQFTLGMSVVRRQLEETLAELGCRACRQRFASVDVRELACVRGEALHAQCCGGEP